jgi:hypothetical protein
MTLDIRLPIGLLFSILGSLLVLFGLWSDRSIYAKSLDININVIWGLVMVVFGAIMAGMALGRSRRDNDSAQGTGGAAVGGLGPRPHA